jgi:Flp pilus assembly protein TadD
VIRTKQLTAILMAILAATAACDRGADDDATFDVDAMEQARAGWPEDLSARIDSGNVAYREGRYDEAAAVFRRATEEAPDVAATWFGLHMAESARGNQAAADSALLQAEALTPGLGRGHPMSPVDEAPDGDALPPGHPPIR